MTKTQMIGFIKTELDKLPDLVKPSKTRTMPLSIPTLPVIYINPKRLSPGNSKLVDIWVFDTPAGSIELGGSCRNCDTCEGSCYARHQQIQYPYVPIFRLVNLYLITYEPDHLNMLIKRQLKSRRKPVTTFRIHSSGDFYNQGEIDFWNTFVKSHSEINFYAYTKVDKLSDFTAIEDNANFNLLRSMIEHNGVKYRNYGTIGYVTKLAKKVGGFVCPATIPGNDVKCNAGCDYCVTNDKALFVIHGTNKEVDKKKDGITIEEATAILEVNREIETDFELDCKVA